jgi:hypothetical protein
MIDSRELADARGHAMSQRWLPLVLPVAFLSTVAIGWTQKLPEPPATTENIEAAYKLSLAAAEEYEFHVGKDENDKPLELVREPKLKWSNPVRSDVQGNVFLWTREGRPLVVGGFDNWFSPRPWMQHEFHSLAEGPLSAKFHRDSVWTTEEAGLKFVAVPNAAAPTADEVQQRLQLRKLASEFSAAARYRNETSDTELRLLPRPIHGYTAPKQGIMKGGLFAFVRSTDPELLLLIEARGKDAATARWQFAAARMTNMAELRLRHRDKQVWEAELLPWRDVNDSHKLAYTAFIFNKVPDFLMEAVAKPKP